MVLEGGVLQEPVHLFHVGADDAGVAISPGVSARGLFPRMSIGALRPVMVRMLGTGHHLQRHANTIEVMQQEALRTGIQARDSL